MYFHIWCSPLNFLLFVNYMQIKKKGKAIAEPEEIILVSSPIVNHLILFHLIGVVLCNDVCANEITGLY